MNFWKMNFKIRLLSVFLLFFCVFFLAHLSINGFTGMDDPYYHAKHSLLMAESGDWTLVGPWLKFHFLSYAPTDPWWGFHVIQAVFIKFFGVFLGTKIWVSILAALVFAVFYFILADFKIKKLLFWTFLFFSSSLFLEFRLFLERPFLLALSILPLSFFFLARKKHFSLFFLSLFYALFYNLAPLVIFFAVFYLLVEFFLKKKLDLKPLIASAGGILGGIIIHPASFNYFNVIFIHFFRVIFLKFAGVDLGVGEEIQTQGFFYFLSANFLALIFYIVATVLFLAIPQIRKGERAVVNWFLFLMSSLWFIITLFVPRGAEYWLPFGWLFIALIVNEFIGTGEFNQLKIWIKNYINFKILSFFILSLVFILIINNFLQLGAVFYKHNLGAREKYFEDANIWIKSNTPAGSIIFYDNWSLWPIMFFYNDHNRYISGMDPTFLYEYDKNLFWTWRNISHEGIYCDKDDGCPSLSPPKKTALVKKAILEKFGSEYVLAVNLPESKLIKLLDNREKDFFKVYANKELLIYGVLK